MNVTDLIGPDEPRTSAEGLTLLRPDRLETWVARNSSWLALGVIAAAFAVRFACADSCYLNPDEALHFDVARPSRWLWAYEASRTVTHPPLFILVLHGILFFGRSEMTLRLPSLLGGTVALWFAFAWIRRCLGEIAALAGLGFLALSPAAVSASSEVRQYGLLLFFVCASLYATERALSERSTTWAIIQGLFLVGALLTHYAAILVISSLGLYLLVRSLVDDAPRRIVLTFVVSYLALASLFTWLYLGRVRGSIPFGPGSSMDYLQRYYYSADRETPLRFVWRAIHGTFYHVVGNRTLTFVFILVFLAGLCTLLTSQSRAQRLLAILVITFFGVGFAAAVAQVFPFAGSRHQTYLLPLLAVVIAAPFTRLPSGWGILLLLIGVAIGPFWINRTAPDNDRRFQSIRDMTAAIEYLRRTVPSGTVLFVDGETFNLLTYYLARNDANLDTWPGAQWYVEVPMNGYRVVVVAPKDNYIVHFRADDALDQVNEAARALGVSHFWIVSAAWLEKSLASQIPSKRDREVGEFGRISVIEVGLPSGSGAHFWFGHVD